MTIINTQHNCLCFVSWGFPSELTISGRVPASHHVQETGNKVKSSVTSLLPIIAMRNKIIKSLEKKGSSREMTERRPPGGPASRVGHYGLGLIHSLLNVRPLATPSQPVAPEAPLDASLPPSRTRSIPTNCHRKERKEGVSPKA